MLIDDKGWRRERLCLLKGIATTHSIPVMETTRLRRQTWVSHAVDKKRKPNHLETRNNTWLLTQKPVKKKSEWKCQLQASEVYLHWVLVTVQWTLSRVTNCRSMTSHSLPGIRNKQSSWFFITCAKPEDTLTRKASGNHSPHRESTFTDWRATVHCILTTTTPGLQDLVIIVWNAQSRHGISWTN